MSKSPVSAEDFVLAIINERNLPTVAQKLGVSLNSVTQRYHKYRKAGVKLPNLQRKSGHYLSVDHLNKLIKQHKAHQ